MHAIKGIPQDLRKYFPCSLYRPIKGILSIWILLVRPSLSFSACLFVFFFHCSILLQATNLNDYFKKKILKSNGKGRKKKHVYRGYSGSRRTNECEQHAHCAHSAIYLQYFIYRHSQTFLPFPWLNVRVGEKKIKNLGNGMKSIKTIIKLRRWEHKKE